VSTSSRLPTRDYTRDVGIWPFSEVLGLEGERPKPSHRSVIHPPRERIFNASLHVAERVAACIFDQGLARVPRPADVGELIRSRVYRPVYPE
jgi:hypothetical protein